MKRKSKTTHYASCLPQSVLNVLPTSIIALISLMCAEEREVLSYMIRRSLRETDKRFKRQPVSHGYNSPAVFNCDCFDCYASFWHRWGTLPNGRLIHQVIDAFEESFNNDRGKKSNNGKKKENRKKKKIEKNDQQKSGCYSSKSCTKTVETLLVDVVRAVQVPKPDGSGGVTLMATPPVIIYDGSLVRKLLPDLAGLFTKPFV